MANPPQLTWLHLSDVHYDPRSTLWDDDRVLRALRQDFARMQKKYELRPDLIFVTGDLACGPRHHTPIKRQYQGVARFLEGIRRSFSPPVPKSHVFLVPGNNDVNLDLVGRPETDWLASRHGGDGAATVSGLLRDKGPEWRRIMERLSEYRSFLKRNGYNHLLSDSERLSYAVKREVRGLKIGIAGFNTAWSCTKDPGKGNVWFGRWQIENARTRLDDCALRIALTHHPLHWFRQEEATDVSFEINERFHFHLYGHDHTDWLYFSTREHVSVAAGTCYPDSRKEDGYSWTRVVPDRARGQIFFRHYEGSGWVGRNIPRVADEEGICNLDMPWLNRKMQSVIRANVNEFQSPEELLRKPPFSSVSTAGIEQVSILPGAAAGRISKPRPGVTPRTVTIFLASSSELRAARDAFSLYFGQHNGLEQRGLRLKIIGCERFLNAMSKTRLQDEYNKALRSCDLFVCLFFTKAGKFTEEEFDVALEQFQKTGKPRIFTFFKDAPIRTGKMREEDVMSLMAFRKKLAALGHFSTHFKNIDDLKLQFRDQLEELYR